MAEKYEARVKLNAGPFKIDDSRPTVIGKAELKPAVAEKKADSPK